MKQDLQQKIMLINELREKGLTYEAIGKTLQISRQRVHQILKRYSTFTRVSTENDCFICGNKEIELHHINGNPKDNRINNLITLCSYCHHQLHLSQDFKKQIMTRIVDKLT